MATNQRFTDSARSVWNRACYCEGANLCEGDLALAALLLVDGDIQNGGLGHAFDLMAEELAEGIKGYEFFGLHEMAAIIKPRGGKGEAEFNQRYYAFTGRGDNLIMKRFQEMFSQHPNRVAPVGPAAGSPPSIINRLL